MNDPKGQLLEQEHLILLTGLPAMLQILVRVAYHEDRSQITIRLVTNLRETFTMQRSSPFLTSYLLGAA